MGQEHRYEVDVTWTGNLGPGTSSYRSYRRDHEVAADGKPIIPGSSDPAFRGDRSRWNPEELLVVALSQCHMLFVLHLAADTGVVITGYRDHAAGHMAEDESGAGRFTEVVLRPEVVVAEPSMVAKMDDIHHRAHELCFIANSVNFPVRCQPTTTSTTAPAP